VYFEPRVVHGADDGTILVAGHLSGTYEIGGKILVTKGSSDIVVHRFGVDGNLKWVSAFGGAGEDWVTGLVSDSKGDVLVIGAFEGTLQLGNLTRSSAGLRDVYVTKLAAGTGEPLWLAGLGSEEADRPGRLAIDNNGDVWSSGMLGGVARTFSLTPSDRGATYVAKLTSAHGAIEKAHSLYGTPIGVSIPATMAVDLDGYLVTSGRHAVVRLIP
jgi:hypothetical protein